MLRKRSAGGNGRVSGFKPSCRIKPNAIGDWQILPPAGSCLQVGDGTPGEFCTTNDDFYVTGNAEIQNMLYVHSQTHLYGTLFLTETANLAMAGGSGESCIYSRLQEEITIPVGQGSGLGIQSTDFMLRADSVIIAVVARVTQAPGGGATIWNVGQISNLDQFIAGKSVALGTTGTSAGDNDGADPGPPYQAAAAKIKVNTNVDVTGSDMKVKVTVFYMQMFPPDS